MKNPKEGGTAFPVQDAYSLSTEQGMSLRDYFAAKALQSILYADRASGLVGVNLYEQRCAEDAYKVADAMLKARDA